jgi:YidC/Oxa1 family membrane protein insertase
MINPFSYIYEIILWSLLTLYGLLGQNIGLAIIALTLIIKTLTLPLTNSATKTQKKMAQLKPHFDEIKQKHKEDKMKQQEEQLKLMKEHNVNPAAGCVPILVQIVLLITLYNVFVQYLGPDAQIDGEKVHTTFAYLDLAKTDPLFILPIVAGITQFILGAMLTPAKPIEVRKNDSKEEIEQKEDFAQTLQQVQSQMLYLTPIMTGVISLSFPSGLALYWVVSNIYSIIQQYYIVGTDHLVSHLKQIRDIITRKATTK